MLHTLAIANYRSLLQLTVSLAGLNLITGANDSGKSDKAIMAKVDFIA